MGSGDGENKMYLSFFLFFVEKKIKIVKSENICELGTCKKKKKTWNLEIKIFR